MTCVIDEARLPCNDLGERPGMVALAQVAMDRDPELHSYGIHNCRAVRGGGHPSKHGNSEAWDAGGALTAIRRLVAAIEQRADALHVQRIIFYRQIWDCRHGWRPFTGAAGPHLDHAHIEQDRWGATHLTRNAIVRAFGIPRHRRPADVPKLDEIMDQVRLPAKDGRGTVRVQLQYDGGIRTPDGDPVGGDKGGFKALPPEVRRSSTGRFRSLRVYDERRGLYELTDTGGTSFTPT